MIIPRKYNPGFLTDDELVASFCVRTSEFESMVEMLRDCTGSSNPHQIVIGPRGSGKTILLLRIAAEVRRDAGLSSRFFPIIFAEESYDVATAGEFWLECLSCLAVQGPRREGGPDLQRTVEDLRTNRDDHTLAERCLASLLDFSDREDRRLVLMTENLNMMFRDMADPDAGWRLRHTLQNERRIVMLASATSRFDEIDNPERALYDLFRVRTLRPLNTKECAVLWETVSGRCPAPRTIRALEILTGGSPRLLTIVARFGAGRSFPELMADLLDLVDEHTEYFKGHIESLPPQERRVYLALAELWKPATTKEVADRSRMGTNKCSAQLARLIERGVVQFEGGTARRKQYYLTERLYNIYYLIRRARGPGSLVEALVQFMETYYSPAELKDIVARLIREAGSFNGKTLSLCRIAIPRLVDSPALSRHRVDLQTLRAGTDQSAKQEAMDLFAQAVALNNQNRAADSLPFWDEFLLRFGESADPTLLESVAMALFNKGYALRESHRPQDAVATWQAVVRRFAKSEDPTVVEVVAKSLFNLGDVLADMNRHKDALAVWGVAVRRFGESPNRDVLGWVAQALVVKGVILDRMDCLREALAAFDEAVHRIARDTSTVPCEWMGEALLRKAGVEFKCLRYEAAVETASRALAALPPESLGRRVRGHLIRAKAILADGNRSTSALDVVTGLALLQRVGALPYEALDALMYLSVELGPAHMRELIRASPSAKLLLPLATALERQIGLEPRVAQEVEEVAQDIGRSLVKLKEGRAATSSRENLASPASVEADQKDG